MVIMKERISKLEENYDDMNDIIIRHENEITSLRNSRHEANNLLQNHNGKFLVLEGQQKSILQELILIRADLNEWMKKTNALINWKFMLIGGAGVGTAMIGGVVALIVIYLNYFYK